MTSIIMKLNTLLEEVRKKGFEPDLRAGMSQKDLADWQSSTGMTLPEDLRELFGWRNGCADIDGELGTLFLFRDNAFIGLEDYESAMEGIKPFVSSYEEYGRFPFHIERSIPIAAFEGDYYFVPLDPLIPNHPHPIVCVGEDLAVYFYSLASMLDTCIAWAQDNEFMVGDPTPFDESIAWEKYNPGVFEIEI